MYYCDYYSNFSRINKHYHIISKQMLNATQRKGLLESMLNADNKYLRILDVISRGVDVISKEVKVIIKNSYRTIKKYFSSFKVVGKTPKCNTARTKRTEDDSGGTDSDPDPDCPTLLLTQTQKAQRNRFILSWQTAPGYCSMPQGVA